jgi:ribosomal protein S18 acetylase RimI-like enzyme
LKIRSFEQGDIDAVVKLWQDCNLVVPWNNPYKDIQRKINVGTDLFLVGEFDSVIVASVMGGYEGHRGWVNYLAISPDYRHRGYAKSLMAELESLLQAMGCPKINLLVRNTNVDVIEFYQSLGYSIDQSVSLGKRLIPDN